MLMPLWRTVVTGMPLPPTILALIATLVHDPVQGRDRTLQFELLDMGCEGEVIWA